MFVTGLVLAAGSSQRMGQPKQLLPYGETTLLGATLDRARECGFDQLIVTLGNAAPRIRSALEIGSSPSEVVVENPEFTTGCGSSIAAGLGAVDPKSHGLVLLLGDQPGIAVESVRHLVATAATRPVGVSKYSGALAHPFWFRRDMFGALRELRGDKAVWKLLASGRYPVTEVGAAGPVPPDVDTWDDYEALLRLAGMPADVTSRGAR